MISQRCWPRAEIEPKGRLLVDELPVPARGTGRAQEDPWETRPTGLAGAAPGLGRYGAVGGGGRAPAGCRVDCLAGGEVMTVDSFFAGCASGGARKLIVTRDGQNYVALAETMDQGKPRGYAAGTGETAAEATNVALARLPEDRDGR